MEWFNLYAFAQVAIYGSPFIQAAKDTWNLLSSKGLDAIINDDLVRPLLSPSLFLSFFLCEKPTTRNRLAWLCLAGRLLEDYYAASWGMS